MSSVVLTETHGRVGLIRIGAGGAVIAFGAHPVLVLIGLVWIEDLGAVVDGIVHPVDVRVRGKALGARREDERGKGQPPAKLEQRSP